MNHHERTAAALGEINPPVAAAVRRVGPSGSGLALPGLLGWLPQRDLVQLTRACWLMNTDADPPYPYPSHRAMAEAMRSSVWKDPRLEAEEALVHEAVLIWSRLAGRVPLLDLMAVQAGEVLT